MAKYRDVVHDGLEYLLVIVYCVSKIVTSQEVADLPVEVSRRSSEDIVYFNSNASYRCPSDNITYLVNERRCVDNEDLFNGKFRSFS